MDTGKNLGWIKIYRSIQDHWVFSNADYLKAWITILLSVNYEDKKVAIQGEIISCDKGQSLYSIEQWVRIFGKGWTYQRCRTFLNLLKKDNMITLEGLSKTTRLTVCNYESYQDKQQTKNKQSTNNQQTTNEQLTTTKEGEENKENNTPYNPPIEPEEKPLSESAIKFHKFQTWCVDNAPSVLRMQVPMTEAKLNVLKSKYKMEAIIDVLKAMDNKPNLIANYKSAGDTCDSWLRRAVKRGEKVLLDGTEKNKPKASVIKSASDHPASKDNTLPTNPFNETERQKYHRANDWAKVIQNMIPQEEYRAKYPYDKTAI